jgi:hypothetical protein
LTRIRTCIRHPGIGYGSIFCAHGISGISSIGFIASIESARISGGEVRFAEISDGGVGAAEIGVSGVGSAQIGEGGIWNLGVGDGGVGHRDLVTGLVVVFTVCGTPQRAFEKPVVFTALVAQSVAIAIFPRIENSITAAIRIPWVTGHGRLEVGSPVAGAPGTVRITQLSTVAESVPIGISGTGPGAFPGTVLNHGAIRWAIFGVGIAEPDGSMRCEIDAEPISELTVSGIVMAGFALEWRRDKIDELGSGHG